MLFSRFNKSLFRRIYRRLITRQGNRLTTQVSVRGRAPRGRLSMRQI